jgi:phage/plasmid-like protein (TIGR03299 family)
VEYPFSGTEEKATMAHEIHIIKGQASIMYVGNPPWHGLGYQNLPLRPRWNVTLVPMQAAEGKRRIPIPSRFAVVREDLWLDRQAECPVLGVVGTNYKPLQNDEAFTFFDEVVGRKAAMFHTTGVLGEGRRVWILAKMPDDIHVVGDDIAQKYLLLSNSHDGTSAVQVKFTPIRVVCQNTLTIALQRGSSVRVSHTKNVVPRLQNTESMLGIINAGFDEIERHFKAMAKVTVNSDRLTEYLLNVFPKPEGNNERLLTAAAKSRSECEYLFSHGIGHREKGVNGTLWAAYNGITQYVDHKNTKQSNEKRLETIWFGDGYAVKARAYEVAKQKIVVWN